MKVVGKKDGWPTVADLVPVAQAPLPVGWSYDKYKSWLVRQDGLSIAAPYDKRAWASVIRDAEDVTRQDNPERSISTATFDPRCVAPHSFADMPQSLVWHSGPAGIVEWSSVGDPTSWDLKTGPDWAPDHVTISRLRESCRQKDERIAHLEAAIVKLRGDAMPPPACTCHPDDAPVPCAHRHALSECLEVFNADVVPRSVFDAMRDSAQASIGQLRAEVARATEISDHWQSQAKRLSDGPPIKPTPAEVAATWLAAESLYYRTQFDPGAQTRLTAVISAARWTGRQQAKVDAEAQQGQCGSDTPQPLPPRKGDFVTCDNGHLVCEIVREPEPGHVTAALGAWRGQCGAGQRCDQCDAPYWRHDPIHGFQIHIKGRGWV